MVRDFFKLASDGATPNELATLANLQGWPNQNGETKRWTARQLIRILTKLRRCQASTTRSWIKQQMSTGEITLALVDDAAEIVGRAVEQKIA